MSASPPASYPLMIFTTRSAMLAQTLPLDIIGLIFRAEAALTHARDCPSACHYGEELDGGHQVVHDQKPCLLSHCPHETSPSYILVHVCRSWSQARILVELWATIRLRVDANYNDHTDIETLLVCNRAEYEFCVQHSGTSRLKLSIGCDPQQRSNAAWGRPIVKRPMVLEVGDALKRLSSLCFDGSNGRLMAMLGMMNAPKIEDVYILKGSNDHRWSSEMFMVRDALWMSSGTVRKVYCSFEFTSITGPLTFRTGYENFVVLDLSCVGSYHEAVVEWIVALGVSLEDFRIQASVSESSHVTALPNASYALRRANISERVVSRIRRLRIAHYIGLPAVHHARRDFLSRFVFPVLQELVLEYYRDVAIRSNVSWLLRNAFPALTTFQLTINSVQNSLLGDVLRCMPALQTLVFAPHNPWDSRSWGAVTSSRGSNQDNSFLSALENASGTLEVVRVGGDVWFNRQALVPFLARRAFSAMRIFTVQAWYSVVDRADLDAMKTAVLPVLLQCGEHARCPFSVATGSMPPGPPPDRWEDDWECGVCHLDHPLSTADHISIEVLKVQEARRTYWGGF